MLRLIEVASQSETFSKRVLENHESKIFAGMAQPGHYRGVFSIDRPPLLADRQTQGDYSPTNEPSGAMIKLSPNGNSARQPPSSIAPITRKVFRGLSSNITCI